MTARFTVRKPEDFIALAPVVLGFQPQKSLVMMTVDSFHARIDIPQDDEIEQCIEALLSPVLKHRVNRVAFLLFDEDDAHLPLQTALIDAFKDAGVEILAALEVSWHQYRNFGDVQWWPLEADQNPLTLEALYLDRAPKFGSREEMAEYIKPQNAEWDADVFDAARLLTENGIEAVMTALSRERASESVELWTKALRGSTPGSEVSQTYATILAFSAWLSGHGALAWCALDLADPDSNWHMLLSTALQQAVSPEKWPG